MDFVTRLPLIGNGPTVLPTADKPERELFDIARSHPEQGRTEMYFNETLSAVARAYTERMARANFFSHVDPSGYGSDWRVRQAGYALPYPDERDANHIESITAWYDSAQGAFNRWMETGHRLHILAIDVFFREQSQIGVGHFFLESSEWGHYWVFLSCPPEEGAI